MAKGVGLWGLLFSFISLCSWRSELMGCVVGVLGRMSKAAGRV